MTDREVMQQALEALEGWENCDKWVWPETALEQSKRNTTESLAALRAALEQQQAEPPQRERVVFPTMLRKMWSGGEVQAWLDENVNKEKNT